MKDLPHSRGAYLLDWHAGAMDGFAKQGGATALGYYDDTIPGVDLLWSWARQFAISDSFFASVMADAPTNQLMLVAASANSRPFSIQPFYPPSNSGLKVNAPYTYTNVGDQLTQKGVSWAWFSESLGQCGLGYVSQENPFQYFASTHASANIRDLSEFSTSLAAGTLPAVSFLQPGPRHNTHPGGGSITEGLTWLDTTLRQIQVSPVWNSTAIIVIWDASGGFWDHVPPPQVNAEGFGPRVPLLVISPFSKTNYVSHVVIDDVSILSFIQKVYGLGPLNARNVASGDLGDLFVF